MPLALVVARTVVSGKDARTIVQEERVRRLTKHCRSACVWRTSSTVTWLPSTCLPLSLRLCQYDYHRAFSAATQAWNCVSDYEQLFRRLWNVLCGLVNGSQWVTRYGGLSLSVCLSVCLPLSLSLLSLIHI